MATSGFPSTKPALTMTLNVGAPILVGSISRGNAVTVVPIVGGTLTSEPDSGMVLDGTFVGTGNDYIHYDTGGRHMRLDAHAVVRDQAFEHIYVKYFGIIDVTPEMTLILGGNDQARSTDFGHQFIHVQFETGAERYRDLEVGVYVGAGRFLIDRENFNFKVEYKISRLIASSASVEGKTDADAGPGQQESRLSVPSSSNAPP